MKTLIEKLFAWFGAAMGDGESPSASRLIAVPSLLAVNVLPTLVWVGLSIFDHRLLEVPGTVIGYIGAINTALLGFVIAQKRQEKNG
jgi:hypothetical protein